MKKILKIAVSSLLFVLAFSCASSPKKNESPVEKSSGDFSELQNGDFSSSEKKSENNFSSVHVSSCANDCNADKNNAIENNASEKNKESENIKKSEKSDFSNEITLLFAGDIMAHTENYQISTYEKIWRDVKFIVDDCDLAFANIEAPIDTTKAASSYPNFNMTQKYVQAAVDGGFDVFSLCNNHSNDHYLKGIKETIKTTERICDYAAQNGNKVYFSGLKESPESDFTYNLIEKKGWKILFLPVTELLNRPDSAEYVNYIKTDDASRKKFLDYVKNLREKNPCTLFVLSLHTAEPEYTRVITERQNKFYEDLLDCGVDIVWANHAHIIKNRKIIVDTIKNSDKLIMYANGNTISGQRKKPDFVSKNPNGERDNTGDGLFYKVTLTVSGKNENNRNVQEFEKNKLEKKIENYGSVKIKKCEPIFITTYINTANEYVIKPLNQDFVDYLYSVPRKDWAKYIERRIKINAEATKDLIEWR